MSYKVYGMIGLAQKAGKVVTGEEGCAEAIKKGKSKLVIIAENSSDNTKKKFMDMCFYRNIPYIVFGTKELLGKYTGKKNRAVLSIRDKNFATTIKHLYDQESNGGELFV
ncbi:MAG: 50S ribosomal protein L7ae [Clostridiaceae bacterium]|nr:50S ribosomal protein L7ae [Clostridiaceae bacterium]